MCSFLLSLNVYAAHLVKVDHSFQSLPLGQYAQFLKDNNGRLTIDSLLSGKYDQQFFTNNRQYPDFGFTKASYWVKLDVILNDNKEQNLYLELAYPLMDQVDFYEVFKDTVTTIKTGYNFPFKNRPINHRNFLFELNLQPQQQQVYYLRLNSGDHLSIPLTLWNKDSFNENENKRHLVWGALLGIMIIMALYNFMLFLSIRDLSFLYYVCYLICFVFWQSSISGFTYQYFWPDNFNNHYLHIVDALLLFFVINLSRSILNSKRYSPRLDKVLAVLALAFLCIIPLSVLFDYGQNIQIVNVFLLIAVIVFFSSGIIAISNNYKPAMYFMGAWFLLVIAAVIYILKINGLIASNNFTNYVLQVGSAFEVVIISLGLGARFRTMKAEKIKIQQEALDEQTKTAESFARFVPKQFLTFLNKKSIQEVELGDQVMKNMTILFSDIRDFTGISDQLSPQESFNMLNSYLMTIGPIIRKHNGFIDKYIGDAIMALFPNNSDSAILAAIDMANEIKRINLQQAKYGLNPINVGIGIHSGNLILGTIGEQNRIETTVISDAVNVASRLERLTKDLGAQIIMSRSSFNTSKTQNYCVKDLGTVSIKGKQHYIEIVEIVSLVDSEKQLVN